MPSILNRGRSDPPGGPQPGGLHLARGVLLYQRRRGWWHSGHHPFPLCQALGRGHCDVKLPGLTELLSWFLEEQLSGKFLDPRCWVPQGPSNTWCTSSLAESDSSTPATNTKQPYTQNAASSGKGEESPSLLFPTQRHPNSWYKPRLAGRRELASPEWRQACLAVPRLSLRRRKQGSLHPELWGIVGRAPRSQTFLLYTSLEKFYLKQNLFYWQRS